MESSQPTRPEKSGKREAGWVVFLTVSGAVFWSMWEHAAGGDMVPFVPLFIIAWPASFAAAVGPHVVHHLRPRARNNTWAE